MCDTDASIPSFFKHSLCPLSPPLGDGVVVQEYQADQDEQDGRDRHQQLEGEGHRPGLGTLALVIARKSAGEVCVCVCTCVCVWVRVCVCVCVCVCERVHVLNVLFSHTCKWLWRYQVLLRLQT